MARTIGYSSASLVSNIWKTVIVDGWAFVSRTSYSYGIPGARHSRFLLSVILCFGDPIWYSKASLIASQVRLPPLEEVVSSNGYWPPREKPFQEFSRAIIFSRVFPRDGTDQESDQIFPGGSGCRGGGAGQSGRGQFCPIAQQRGHGFTLFRSLSSGSVAIQANLKMIDDDRAGAVLILAKYMGTLGALMALAVLWRRVFSKEWAVWRVTD